MAGALGFEPKTEESKSSVLPLHHAPILVHPQGVGPCVTAYKAVPQYRRGRGAYYREVTVSNLSFVLV